MKKYLPIAALLVVILILIFLFVYFAKNSAARKECAIYAKNAQKVADDWNLEQGIAIDRSAYNRFYQRCLNEKGFEN